MDEDSALDMDGDGYAAAASDSEEELVCKTIPHSLTINRTRRKSPKVILSDALMSVDFEDVLPRQHPRKNMHASPVPPSAGGYGYTKYF
jgi:hypothetical protein